MHGLFVVFVKAGGVSMHELADPHVFACEVFGFDVILAFLPLDFRIRCREPCCILCAWQLHNRVLVQSH